MSYPIFHTSIRAWLQAIAATLLLTLFMTDNVSAYVIKASGSYSLSATPGVQNFTGTTNATVSVSDGGNAGLFSEASYSASASPFQLSAQSHSGNGVDRTGTDGAGAAAKLTGAQIIFHDVQQLVDLGLTVGGTLDILFNFEYQIKQSEGEVEDNTYVDAHLNISTAGGFNDSAVGTLFSAISFGQTGMFAGLQDGIDGILTASLIDTSFTISRTVTLNPLLSGGDIIDFSAYIGASTRGLDADAFIALSLLDDGNLLTLTDGTSLIGLGVDYTFVTPDTVSSVPEPTTLVLLSLGLFGLGFNRRKRLQ